MKFIPPRRWFRFRLSTWFVLLGILCWAMATRPTRNYQNLDFPFQHEFDLFGLGISLPDNKANGYERHVSMRLLKRLPFIKAQYGTSPKLFENPYLLGFYVRTSVPISNRNRINVDVYEVALSPLRWPAVALATFITWKFFSAVRSRRASRTVAVASSSPVAGAP